MSLTFPPRDETLAFFERLNAKYANDLDRPEQRGIHIDREGIAVWMQEWLRLRASGVGIDEATLRVLTEIDRIVNPAPPPAPLARLEVIDGRFRAGEVWVVPRFMSEFEAIWLVLIGRVADLHAALDRAAAARCNGIRIFGMLDWPHLKFSPHETGYWSALETVVAEAAARGLSVEWCFFADAQRLVPSASEATSRSFPSMPSARAISTILGNPTRYSSRTVATLSDRARARAAVT